MKNIIVDKIASHMNYDTYRNFQSSFVYSAFLLCVIGPIVGRQVGIGNEVIIPSIYLLDAIYFFLGSSDSRFKTKDVKEIKELYDIFIKNYNKLNKTLEFDNPISIEVLYRYLLTCGYLSYNHKFVQSNKNVKDISPIKGANVLCGNGVCRHISTNLTDILNDYGCDANDLSVLSEPIDHKYILKNAKDYSDDDLQDLYSVFYVITEFFGNVTGKRVKIGDAVFELSDDFKKEIEKEKIKRLVGNHQITVAFKDGYIYFLDPTHNKIYNIGSNNKTLVNSYLEEECIIKDKIPNIDNYKELSIEEKYECIDKTYKEIITNNDLYEKFYKENEDLYKDVYSKVKQIKRRI